ncbi:MAG: prepilin-type N-terminal cleavage/methylation domain-containing protein [Sedimentisphaerales bacterium]|nr:prepilin-type N-terminal cleavage/methylation domain-containing protein [Sedimentisphaerales bacterium]
MKARRSKGFTLVEILIAVLASAIVILAAATCLVIGHRILGKAWRMTILQRDAALVMDMLVRPVKECTSTEIHEGGRTIIVSDRFGSWQSFSFRPEENEIYRQFEEQEPYPMLQSLPRLDTTGPCRVENLIFNVQENRLEIYMELKKDDLITHLASTVTMRNYGL